MLLPYFKDAWNVPGQRDATPGDGVGDRRKRMLLTLMRYSYKIKRFYQHLRPNERLAPARIEHLTLWKQYVL